MAKVGIDCVLYRNVSTFPTGAWVIVPEARDVTLNMANTEADASSRVNRVKAILLAQLDVSVEFELLYEPLGSNFSFFRAAFMGRAQVEFAVLDGAMGPPSQGVRLITYITQFNMPQPLTESAKVNVVVKPAYIFGGASVLWYAPATSAG